MGDEHTWLGSFGERWFSTICDVAACPTAKPYPDVVGTDFFVHDHHHETIRVQVKTTEHATTIADGYSWPLEVAAYNRLREGNTPSYLALVVLNDLHPQWTRHYQQATVVGGAVFWAPLTGLPATTNTSSVSVSLPYANLLTPEGLLGLFPGGDGHG